MAIVDNGVNSLTIVKGSAYQVDLGFGPFNGAYISVADNDSVRLTIVDRNTAQILKTYSTDTGELSIQTVVDNTGVSRPGVIRLSLDSAETDTFTVRNSADPFDILGWEIEIIRQSGQRDEYGGGTVYINAS